MFCANNYTIEVRSEYFTQIDDMALEKRVGMIMFYAILIRWFRLNANILLGLMIGQLKKMTCMIIFCVNQVIENECQNYSQIDDKTTKILRIQLLKLTIYAKILFATMRRPLKTMYDYIQCYNRRLMMKVWILFRLIIWHLKIDVLDCFCFVCDFTDY